MYIDLAEYIQTLSNLHENKNLPISSTPIKIFLKNK